ncbi:MAG TPA: 4-hydroxythreonine-4-phosphate dehydrogenase PdxA, partial [Blastocatellia bacterium]|nr:4-hydroxythreonine-4-phosphate dehydrogenase PdxA [Blastocatellia bacterium]
MTRLDKSPSKPRVGITIGDPAGIGPEIVLRSVATPEVSSVCQPIIIGDDAELRRQAHELALLCDYPSITEDQLSGGELPGPSIFNTGTRERVASVAWGQTSAAGGHAAIKSIDVATRLCLQGRLDAIATAPINKESLKLAGSPFPGHTEMLASLCGSDKSLMCFFSGDLRVVLLSIHVSLTEAIRAVTTKRVIDALMLTHQELGRFGQPNPRIAVAGLNPHASEHGLFGFEEAREIEPAIAACVARGLNVSGPYP